MMNMKKMLLHFAITICISVSLSASVAIAYREAWDVALMETLFECGIEYELLEPVELYVNHAFVETENGALSLSDASFLKSLDTSSTNAALLMEGVDYLIIPGGRDISPSLYEGEDDSCFPHSIDEDISDYILLKYAVENSIPVLGICRGMEMIAVYYGGELISDLGEYIPNYSGIHQSDALPYSFHSICISERDSLLYKAFGKSVVSGLPSNHHQGVTGLENTPLSVTAYTITDGVTVIEAVEYGNVTGILFHPEKVPGMVMDGADVSQYIAKEDVISFFRTLLGR